MNAPLNVPLRASSAEQGRFGRAMAWLVPMPPGDPSRYRPDIDGLRAFAVGLVILFHLGSYTFRGGFIGVDIFFVISGYLIGSLILGEMQAGRFSIVRFYERRLRRILPALIVVLAATTVAGYFCIYPQRFAQYGVSVVAAALSFSNLYFWSNSGYLEGVGTSRALLHTWSLSVEEQFYLALPPFLMLVRRFAPRRLKLCVLAAAAASLLASVVQVRIDPNTAFYMPHTRAWELLMGVIVAMGAVPTLRSGWLRNAVAFTGLALMLGSAILLRGAVDFPGLAAVPPCLGAAMFIAAGAGGQTLVGRVFSWRPVVFVGLISYSLYLWHWPLIILRREYLGSDSVDFGRFEQIGYLAIIFGLAYLTWRFVERPFRLPSMPRRTVFAAAAAGVATVALAGGALVAAEGVPDRYAPGVSRMAAYLDYDASDETRTGSCFLNSRHSFAQFDKAGCLRLSASQPNVILMGDSYAAHLRHGLERALPGVNLLQATASGCKPGIERIFGDPDCVSLARYTIDEFLTRNQVDMLLISGMWIEPEFPKLGRFLDWAAARKLPVVVIGRIVEYDSPLPSLLARSLHTQDPGLPHRHLDPKIKTIDAKLAAFTALHGAVYASPYQALCPAGVCQTTVGQGVPVQYDNGHVTSEGSILVGERMRQAGAFDALVAGGPPSGARPN